MADTTRYLNKLANYLWLLSPGCYKAADIEGTKLVAHRGAHGRTEAGVMVENTLPAFDLCLQNKIWGIELDIQLTLDGEPVIAHDADCGRLFQRPDLIIGETKFEQLRKAVPQIPHLDEIISRYGSKMHLMLEIKESWREKPSLVARVQQALSSLEPEADYHLLSLEPDHLSGFTALPPAAFIDVALTNTKSIIKQNLELGHGAVAGSFALLTPALVQELKAAGRRVGTGQVEHPLIARREAHREIDWIFTDNILGLQQAIVRQYK
jgi:glycerophosphoryl diester phosphodiesterase